MNPSDSILESWQANAENWIQTIDEQEIESRKLVTNQAIIETVTGLNPTTVLDIGCGEGWLTRMLTAQGMDVLGVDGIPALIENAQSKGLGKFQIATYRAIAQKGVLKAHLFDAIVINFALIDKEETGLLIYYLPNILQKNGYVIIQTLHPLSVISTALYKSGWREGSWNGMKRDFVQPYQWYFRTLSNWIQLFKNAHLNLVDLIEPTHPQTLQPASLIFVLSSNL